MFLLINHQNNSAFLVKNKQYRQAQKAQYMQELAGNLNVKLFTETAHIIGGWRLTG